MMCAVGILQHYSLPANLDGYNIVGPIVPTSKSKIKAFDPSGGNF
jgi:hypothetical protein